MRIPIFSRKGGTLVSSPICPRKPGKVVVALVVVVIANANSPISKIWDISFSRDRESGRFR